MIAILQIYFAINLLITGYHLRDIENSDSTCETFVICAHGIVCVFLGLPIIVWEWVKTKKIIGQ